MRDFSAQFFDSIYLHTSDTLYIVDTVHVFVSLRYVPVKKGAVILRYRRKAKY